MKSCVPASKQKITRIMLVVSYNSDCSREFDFDFKNKIQNI